MVMAASNTAHADIDPITGVDLVRIGAVGNAPWMGNGQVQDRAIGRGRVDYEYSIGKLEVTTAQWVEFLNAALDRPANDHIPYVAVPDFWGGAETFSPIPGGRRFAVRPGQGLLPVGDITWRMAAIYCNWLHNGKGANRKAFLNGAYDVGTFTLGTGFTDQRTHNPDACYWLPTWDEVLKAFHFDPAKANPDGTTGGWWRYSNSSDTPLVYGPPNTLVNGLPTEANAGWFDGGNPQYQISLGAYPNTRTPWGLLDAAGATSEWNEEVFGFGSLLEARGYDGSAWGSSLGVANLADAASGRGGDFPSLSELHLGFRIASSVPAPSTLTLMGLGWWLTAVRKRRGAC